jgi:hypothetical protein
MMSLNDKFRIIENHILINDKKNLHDQIENYFENYLNSDIKILIPDYVNQIIWFEGINLENFTINIDSHIKNYLISRRNNMRSLIKKDIFNISNLNKFIKNFISKLEYLNSIIKSLEDKVIKEGIKQLTNLIISDSIILLFIEEQIITFNISVQLDVEYLLLLTKSLKKYDNQETYQQMIKIMSNILKKQAINIKELPLPENIKRIQKLNQILIFINTIKKYFKFINEDIKFFTSPICYLVVEYLNDIIKNNSLYEIEYVFEKIWSNITNTIIFTNSEQRDENINSISNEIISLVNKTLSDNNIDKTFQLINILKFTDGLIGNQTNNEVIKQKIANTLSSENIQESIHYNINNLIIQGKEKDLFKLLNFVTNVKDKDIFISKYYELLIRRLMINFSEISSCRSKFFEFLQIEKKISEYIKNKFGDKLVYKINKVITDTEFSYEDNFNFNKLTIKDFKNLMTVITTSYNNWDINQNEGIITSSIVDTIKNTIMGKHMHFYQKFYEQRYENKRIINWFPHFGEVNIRYLNSDIKMLPIQFMVLEMFNDKDILNICDVHNATFFSNYTTKFRNDIIGSLISGELLKVQNDQIELMKTDNFKNDLIEIFFTHSDYASIWEQNRNNELAHTRIEITNTIINHILKQNTKSKQDLFDIAKQSIKVFELDHHTFDKSIEYMISMDYIKLNDLNYAKLYY